MVESKIKNNETICKKLKNLYKKTNNLSIQRWYTVEEHVPEINRSVICFSRVFNKYYLASFHPCSGWKNSSEKLSNITDWLDLEIFLPFEESFEINEELAKHYGLL